MSDDGRKVSAPGGANFLTATLGRKLYSIDGQGAEATDSVDSRPESAFGRWMRTSSIARILKVAVPIAILALAISIAFFHWPI